MMRSNEFCVFKMFVNISLSLPLYVVRGMRRPHHAERYGLSSWFGGRKSWSPVYDKTL